MTKGALRLLCAIVALVAGGPALALSGPDDVLLFGVPGWVLPGASVDMDFANGRYYGLTPSSMTVSRSSTEYETCNGQLYGPFAGGSPGAQLALTPCGLWIWEARNNGIRNNQTLTANWSYSAPTGITVTSAGTGAEGGASYLDIQVSGTASAAGTVDIYLEQPSAITAAYGQTWTASFYEKLVAGSLANVNANQFGFVEFNGGLFTAQEIAPFTQPTAAALLSQRIVYSATLTNSATNNAEPHIKLGVSSGAVVSLTLRVALVQQEQNPNLNATVASAAMAASGTGGVSGSGVYQVSGGTGTAATLNVTWASGVMTVNSVANAGSYSVLPTSPAALTYVSGGATGWTGATVNLTPTDNSASAFATGPILTSAGAATRNPTTVVATIPALGSSYAFGGAGVTYSPTGVKYFGAVSDGTIGNVLAPFVGASAQFCIVTQKASGGLNYYDCGGSAAVGSPIQYAASTNGATISYARTSNVASSVAGVAPSGLMQVSLGASPYPSGTYFNGFLRRLTLARSAAPLSSLKQWAH